MAEIPRAEDNLDNICSKSERVALVGSRDHYISNEAEKRGFREGYRGGASDQRELLENYAELPTQEQLERDLDVLIVFKNGDVDISLSAERIINYLRGKE